MINLPCLWPTRTQTAFFGIQHFSSGKQVAITPEELNTAVGTRLSLNSLIIQL